MKKADIALGVLISGGVLFLLGLLWLCWSQKQRLAIEKTFQV